MTEPDFTERLRQHTNKALQDRTLFGIPLPASDVPKVDLVATASIEPVDLPPPPNLTFRTYRVWVRWRDA